MKKNSRLGNLSEKLYLGSLQQSLLLAAEAAEAA